MYHNQVHLTPQPGGGWRKFIDYRQLNKACKGMGWPLPSMQAMIERIGAKRPKLFAKMDMPSGYHQAPLSIKCSRETAFITPTGKYEFQRVPMGLKVSTGSFQETIVLGELVNVRCEVYLNNVLVRASNEEQLLCNLRKEYSISCDKLTST